VGTKKAQREREEQNQLDVPWERKKPGRGNVSMVNHAGRVGGIRRGKNNPVKKEA